MKRIAFYALILCLSVSFFPSLLTAQVEVQDEFFGLDEISEEPSPEPAAEVPAELESYDAEAGNNLPAEEAEEPAPKAEAIEGIQDRAPQAAQNYKIGIGDLLQVEVYDEKDLTKEARVLTDGYISFPLLGSIQAAGKTVNQLENQITKLLAAKYLVNPQVTVFVKEFSSVYVFGEVRKPGNFPIFGKMTVFEAITLAGGFTEVANPSKVKVIRHENGKEVSYEVNTERLTKKGDTSGDLELQANDRVVVPRSFF